MKNVFLMSLSLLFLSACNVYEMVGQEAQFSDNFEKNLPRIIQRTFNVKESDVVTGNAIVEFEIVGEVFTGTSPTYNYHPISPTSTTGVGLNENKRYQITINDSGFAPSSDVTLIIDFEPATYSNTLGIPLPRTSFQVNIIEGI
ncbi:MAG: hypothetical protein N4A33_07380 [Bacteriovoracaceae bacterium]|jgi:hypothetical protein|nr:hypothetical protein [Bacteriovoracaceae bacterium]